MCQRGLITAVYCNKPRQLLTSAMAYNEQLGGLIRLSLEERKVSFYEKKMFGGLAFMVDDKMCLGVIKDELMARVGPQAFAEVLEQPGAKEMNFTGRPMKGYVFVEPEGWDRDEQIDYWVEKCLAFNPEAQRSKKRKKKIT